MTEQTAPEPLLRNASGETTTDEAETGNWTGCGLEADVRAGITEGANQWRPWSYEGADR